MEMTMNWLKRFRQPKRLCAHLEAELEEEVEFETEREATVYQLKQDFVYILKIPRSQPAEVVVALNQLKHDLKCAHLRPRDIGTTCNILKQVRRDAIRAAEASNAELPSACTIPRTPSPRISYG
jgi:hypothetical protein